jgi:hypothetical protein
MDEEDHRHQENRPERAEEVGNGSSCILIKTDQEETEIYSQRNHEGIGAKKAQRNLLATRRIILQKA